MLDLSKEYLSEFHSLIEEGKDRILIKRLESLHATDIALILNQIKRDDVHYTYRLIDDDSRSDVLAELDDEVLEDLLSTLTSKEIAEDVVDGLASDDAADIISELSSEKVEEVFSHVKDKESISDVLSLLEYPEGTAGALMAIELVQVEETWSVSRAIREIRVQSEDIENLYTIYVVDDKGKLTGRLSLQNLLLLGPPGKVRKKVLRRRTL